MSLSTFSGDFIDTALSQLGASRIKVVSGKQHVVDFDLGEGLTLTYIFTITNENRCYLQREELFITHNLSPEDLALLHQQGDRLTALMDEIRARSPEVSCEE